MTKLLFDPMKHSNWTPPQTAILWGFVTLAKPQTPKMQEVDAAVVLQQVVLLFNTQSKLNNIEIIEEHDTEVPRIYCDENQIKQVFINILQNAVDAMPNGGIIKTQILCHDSIESTVNEGTIVDVMLPIYSSFLKRD